MITVEQFNQRGAKNLPGHLGLVITHVDASEIRAELAVKEGMAYRFHFFLAASSLSE